VKNRNTSYFFAAPQFYKHLYYAQKYTIKQDTNNALVALFENYLFCVFSSSEFNKIQAIAISYSFCAQKSKNYFKMATR